MAEILREGWLTKSPPDWKFWTSKWKKRYFVLSSGQLPGQCRLLYYMDNAKTHLRGSINLDQCEQVDAYLTFESKNQRVRYEWIFDIRVPKRVYYLVAINESEMNSWVNDLCCVCNLQKEDDPQSGSDRNCILPETTNADQCANGSGVAVLKYNNGFANRVPSGGSPMPLLPPAAIASDKRTVSVANGAINRTSAQGYIPLTDCISGPPRPVRDFRDRVQTTLPKPDDSSAAAAADRPPSHPPPPLPQLSTTTDDRALPRAATSSQQPVPVPVSQDMLSTATVGNPTSNFDPNDRRWMRQNSECVPAVEQITLKPDAVFVLPPKSPGRQIYSNDGASSPPPRPPKRSEFSGTVNGRVNGRGGHFRPMIDGGFISEQDFRSLPRNPKRKVNNSAQMSTSTFECNTLPLPVRGDDREMKSDDESKFSGSLQISDSASTISNSLSSENAPMDDYQNMALPAKTAGVRLPPEVHRELKPQRYRASSLAGNALQIPSSKEAQPHLPYRIDRDQKQYVGGRKNVNASSIDLSRRISFSKRRDANAAELPSRVGVMTPVRRRRVTSTSTSLTESDEGNASSETAAPVEYVEVEAEEPPTAHRLPPPSTATTGSAAAAEHTATGKPPAKTSYVVISQEKTQALIKTKSEQDTMYRIGTLERNKSFQQQLKRS